MYSPFLTACHAAALKAMLCSESCTSFARPVVPEEASSVRLSAVSCAEKCGELQGFAATWRGRLESIFSKGIEIVETKSYIPGQQLLLAP